MPAKKRFQGNLRLEEVDRCIDVIGKLPVILEDSGKQ
jgi:hypothetical protein